MDEWSSTETDDLDEELIQFVKPELRPGELLIWASKPGLRCRKKTRDWMAEAMIWAGGLLILSVCCLTASVLSNRAGQGALEAELKIVGFLSGVVGFLVITGMLASLFSGDSERSKLAGQVYALTDRRAIIWVIEPTSQAVSVHTFDRGIIKPELLHRVEYPDGSGDVRFHEAYKYPTGFSDVENVRRVEELVRFYLIASDLGVTS